MSFWARRSLAIKIPLLTSVLLLAALTAMSIASYVELQREVTDLATGRLKQAAEQMATVLGASGRQRLGAMQQLLQRPEVIAILKSRDPSQEAAIREIATTYLGTAVEVGDVELWDPSGERLLVAGATFPEVTGELLKEQLAELAAGPAVIGKIRPEGEGLLYPVGGRVQSDGVTLGYLVERRRITNPSQTVQTIALLSGFIGSQASIVAGNADGSAWTDLTKKVSGVPINGSGRLWDYQREGMPRTFAWATPIPNTPWIVAIEFPRAVVLEPTQRLLWRSLAIAAVLLILSAAVGWAMTRRITTPLRQVTEAAEAVAESRHHVHVEIDREDEIGRLADSFNKMATKVELGRLDLELRVETRTSELRAANRELEAFSYSVSHDLRAPLRAIAGFVQILEEDHAGSLDDTAKRHLDRVKANARRMGQLIDDLLAFSQIGRTTMLRQALDMKQMAATIAQEAIAASGRAIDLSIEEVPPASGEAGLMNQVLVNLISNAVKFTSRVERPAITIGSRIDNGETIYFVRDNGVGFDDRYAEKLFGVFQRLHRPDDFEGTGVGLAIVHRIITRHGGRVWAEGKVNAGATFYFTLPTAKVAEGKTSTFAMATADKA
jgi:signal transduction histidine kinase